MESPDVRVALRELKEAGVVKINHDRWRIMVGEEALTTAEEASVFFKLLAMCFGAMQGLASKAYVYFGLAKDSQIDTVHVPIELGPREQKLLQVCTEANPYQTAAE